MPERILAPARYEAKDLGVRPAAIAASLAAAFVGMVLLAVFLLYPHTTTDRHLSEPVPTFAAPRLQPSPRADMTAFAALQARQRDTAYWLDRGQGRVHLPIGLAMRKLAAEGIPDWPTKAPR